MTKVINLFGGPGTGKSSTAAELFSLMKWEGYNVELVSEYAKKVTWEGHTNLLHDQLYLLAKQNRSLERLRGQVEYIITDSPLLLGAHYTKAGYLNGTFLDVVFALYDTYDNVNIMLKRHKPYLKVGRSQTEEEAKNIDVKLEILLHNNDIPYYNVDALQGCSADILNIITSIES